jgi:hypothetical protein
MSIEITSVVTLLEAVAHSKATENAHAHIRAWFRGQGDKSWTLRPRVYRDNFAKDEVGRVLKERLLTQDFFALSAPIRDTNLSDAEIYFVQQHYAMPTRLLDWSLNPLAAVFFALDPPDKDGMLFIIDAIQFDTDRGLCTPRSNEVVGAMQAIFQWNDITWPAKILPIRPSHTDKRISAQSGCFTFHPPVAPEVTVDRNKSLCNYVIPSAAKNSLRKQLQLLNIDEFTIYGDLDHLAERLKRAHQVF